MTYPRGATSWWVTNAMAKRVIVAGVAAAISVVALGSPARAAGGAYQQTNLVSDQSGVASVTDPNLVNPWGISFSPSGPFWVSDNGTGLSTLYNTAGIAQTLVVTVALPSGGSGTSSPTGQVFNATTDFTVTAHGQSARSVFIFATEDGTISGWSPSVDRGNSIVAVDNSAVPTAGAGAVYKGLALGSTATATGNVLYAANFRAGTIDVFDTHFAPISLPPGAFVDANLPAGYAPFNIQNLGGTLYVTYAQQNSTKHDDVAGPGHGYLDLFDTSGNFIKRLISNGPLDSPWGLAIAPASFGAFSNDLLVGNFGDGHINAFDPTSGAFLGALTDASSNPISISGLWGLIVGNGHSGGDANTLYFTAGSDGEQHGLFGSLTSIGTIPSPTPAATPELGSGELLAAGLLPLVGALLYRLRASGRR